MVNVQTEEFDGLSLRGGHVPGMRIKGASSRSSCRQAELDDCEQRLCEVVSRFTHQVEKEWAKGIQGNRCNQLREAIRHVQLHGDRLAIDTVKCRGRNASEHASPLRSPG